MSNVEWCESKYGYCACRKTKGQEVLCVSVQRRRIIGEPKKQERSRRAVDDLTTDKVNDVIQVMKQYHSDRMGSQERQDFFSYLGDRFCLSSDDIEVIYMLHSKKAIHAAPYYKEEPIYKDGRIMKYQI